VNSSLRGIGFKGKKYDSNLDQLEKVYKEWEQVFKKLYEDQVVYQIFPQKRPKLDEKMDEKKREKEEKKLFWKHQDYMCYWRGKKLVGETKVPTIEELFEKEKVEASYFLEKDEFEGWTRELLKQIRAEEQIPEDNKGFKRIHTDAGHRFRTC
jgi:hypothetical protein